MEKSHHAHPFTIMTNLWRVAYLTIIPVLRGFLGALNGSFTSWLRGAWIDILILLLMIAIAVWRWLRVSYTFDEEGISIAGGVLNRRYTQIPWSRVVTLSVVHSFLLQPFRAVRLRADTLGGSFKDADFTILLSPKRADALMSMQREPAPRALGRNYSPATKSVLALSLLTSNSFVGIVFIATFVSQTGRLLGNEFSDALIGTVEEAARTLAVGVIPPAAAVLAGLMLAGWMVAFLMEFIRYKNMVVSRRDNTIQITGGLVTKREYCILTDDINFIDIRQSLFTRLLRLYSLYISAVGYGKNKNDISCMVPTEGPDAFRLHLQQLLPQFQSAPVQIRPPKSGFMRFLAQPLGFCLGIPLAMSILFLLFPGWRSFILFVGLMLMAPCVIFFIIRVMDFFRSGVSYNGISYTLRYSKGFDIHTVVIPVEKVVLVELRQGLFQRVTRKNCDLLLRTEAEGRTVHLCRNLRRDQLVDLFFRDKEQPVS